MIGDLTQQPNVISLRIFNSSFDYIYGKFNNSPINPRGQCVLFTKKRLKMSKNNYLDPVEHNPSVHMPSAILKTCVIRFY